MPFGAETDAGGTHFRLWAPNVEDVALLVELREGEGTIEVPMAALDAGWREARVADAGPGSHYRFRVDGSLAVPDPASRFQPADVHGPSEVIDPLAYTWRHPDWRGRPWEETVLYELHVGTFTDKGTFAAAAGHLEELAELGVTAVELMPVADCPGRRNWGYDGVGLYAPDSAYGRPEDLKALVDTAHGLGLMIFLDVVYNHFGPEGNYLHAYAERFFDPGRQTPWGAAIAFDAKDSRPVRDFFIENALYWLEEYRFDGLRLDAVHAIEDRSSPDILEELADAVRAGPGAGRHVHLVLENGSNEAHYLERNEDGRPRHYAAQWNDDIHHAFHVLLTGETHGYYTDFGDDAAAHLGRCLAEGFAYQGDASPYFGSRRGEVSSQLPPTAFVGFVQNHDQIGNRALGDRLTRLAPPEALRAATAALLLAPAVPLLFMGQEWGADQPFLFFCDLGDELKAAVRDGRRREFADFPAFRDEAARELIPDPTAEETFRRSVLTRPAADDAAAIGWLDLHRQLLSLRRYEIVHRLPGAAAGRVLWRAGAGLAVAWQLGDGARLTMMVNLAAEPTPEASPRASGRLLFATEDGFGRPGMPLPAWSTAVFLADARAGPA
ncbi:MAG: malto-oligosyltrehalose trehalohydrolase [Rhodospirillales bacterium]|nr:malto-oligosyltrehalose trehalohydrolase [Rhodospirillales bacterium]